MLRRFPGVLWALGGVLLVQTQAFPLRGGSNVQRRDVLPKDVVEKVAAWNGTPYVVAAFAAGVLATSFIAPWRTYNTAADIPASAFTSHVTIKGEVVNVADGDSVRVRHRPLLSLSGKKSGSGGGKLVDTTIAIRLYGVDAPETAKFGQTGQAFAQEAKAYVKKELQGKRVKLRLLRRDQYGRAVAKLTYGTWLWRHDMSEDLLRKGLAVMYRGGGAEYDGQKAKFESLEAASKKAKRGLWGAARVELPSDYKRNNNRQPSAVPAAI